MLENFKTDLHGKLGNVWVCIIQNVLFNSLDCYLFLKICHPSQFVCNWFTLVQKQIINGAFGQSPACSVVDSDVVLEGHLHLSIDIFTYFCQRVSIYGHN